MLNLNQMSLFVQVVQAGSFAEAARRLGLPPTTLSRHVAQLEDSLQARLLQRTTRKLTLTDAGRRLFDRCAIQIDDLQAAADELAGGSRMPKGSVRIAAPTSFFEFFKMAWVTEFLASYPEVQLEFALSDGMADFIEDGIDVAFRGSAELPDSSLVARKVATTYLALAASPAYLATRGTPRAAEDLAQHDCICQVGSGGSGNWRLFGPQGAVTVAVSGRFCASTSSAQRTAAIAGLGICLQPIGALKDSLRSGQLVEVLPGIASSAGGLYVVYPSRRYVPRAVTAFVDMTVQHLAQVMQAETAD